MSGGPGSALRAPESGTRARAGRGLWRLPSPPVLAARGCSSGAPPAAVRPTRVGLSRLCPAAGPPAGARRSGPSRWGRAGSPAAGPRSRPVLRGSLLPACPTPALTAQRERRSREGGGRRGATGPWVSGLALRLARRGSSRRVPGSAAVRPALRRTADWVSSVIAVPWRGCWRGPRVAGLDDLVRPSRFLLKALAATARVLPCSCRGGVRVCGEIGDLLAKGHLGELRVRVPES